MKLTKRQIDGATAPGKKPVYLWEKSLAGFGVKVLPSGTKKFIVKYRAYGGGRTATQRWITIGAHGQIPLEQARKRAQQILAAVANGDDPQSERLAFREAPRLSDVWARFEDSELSSKKAATARDYRANWVQVIEPKLGAIRVADLSRAHVDKLHRSMSGTPYRANRAIALLSKLMTLSEIWEWRNQGTNPCRYIKKYKEEARERFFSMPELNKLGEAMRNLVDEGAIWPDMANALTLLLLTGARRNEVLSLKWSWVSLDQGLIRLPDSKTGKKTLYLSDHAVRLLQHQQKHSRDPDSSYVFPGQREGKHLINIAKPWSKICERAGLQDARIHDLRHTAASIAVGQGVGLPIIGRLLGHSQTQTTARYAHVDNDPALTAANTIGRAVAGALLK
ncbi:site-specific integrase [Parasedimentitalea maritima]|uniref:Tyrosine-type recombinase/integrase n=1 Tax=Parasedimentitalea maritima TaxID=2578117 RepID=A0A6A4R9V0_9RHOB|nr:site-specific integrase [Zongyanglinia marina]KAE9624749.1 tyrosine-type recombinase/integrase [Zongyanglinia marina]